MATPRMSAPMPPQTCTARARGRMRSPPGTEVGILCRGRAVHKGKVSAPPGGRLTCAYCHQPDDTQAYMAPVRFAKHCVACHALDFDLRVPSIVVPHDTPLIVRAFLRDFYTTAVEECRALPGKQAPEDDGVRGRCQALELVKGSDEDAERPRGRVQAEDAASDAPRGRLSRRGDVEAGQAGRPRGR